MITLARHFPVIGLAWDDPIRFLNPGVLLAKYLSHLPHQ